MIEILEILKYILPAGIVFLTSYSFFNSKLKSEENKEKYQLLIGNQKLITPLRLQAYERIALLLERISPESLTVRLQSPTINARQLHSLMISTVRSEFDHNLSQQIYISSNSWAALKNAKENLIKAINIAGTKVAKDATSTEFSISLFEAYGEFEKDPIEGALEVIKVEIRQFFSL